MDDPADVSSLNGSGWHLLDEGSSTRNRKVVGSNPTSGSKLQVRALSWFLCLIPVNDLVDSRNGRKQEVGSRPGQQRPGPTVEAHGAWLWAGRHSGSEVHFIVYDLDGLVPIGTALLARVDHQVGTAEFAMLAALLDDVPAVLIPAGRRQTDPASDADKGYDSAGSRAWLRGVGSGRGWLGVESSRRSGWGGIAGGWSGRCRG